MDPITAFGAVASIVALSQTALTLSTTLYGLGNDLLSASDDLKSLADDLKTFSQFLTLLSRLLEDSKAFYSDDIYLLTAKIIKDCADLYVKIDGVLTKLGGKGKTNWKRRMMYVMKEPQVRKLLRRLRDLKGTLATILMSLQVDLQLSLLNISCSSKLQRAPEVSLQPHTIQTLKEAQDAARKSTLMYIQAAKSNDFVKGANFGSTALHMYSNPMVMLQQVNHPGNDMAISAPNIGPARSLKSSSSSDSFKSALNEQEPSTEIIREVEDVIHGFRTAMEVLKKFTARIDKDDISLREATEKLSNSLMKGFDIRHAHGLYQRKHGEIYFSMLRHSQITLNHLQKIVAKLMEELVVTLHMYSATYKVLSRAIIQKLHSCSEDCRIKALFELDRISMLTLPEPLELIYVISSDSDYTSMSTVGFTVRKTVKRVFITTYDIDQRLSADYDQLIHRAQIKGFGTDETTGYSSVATLCDSLPLSRGDPPESRGYSPASRGYSPASRGYSPESRVDPPESRGEEAEESDEDMDIHAFRELFNIEVPVVFDVSLKMEEEQILKRKHAQNLYERNHVPRLWQQAYATYKKSQPRGSELLKSTLRFLSDSNKFQEVDNIAARCRTIVSYFKAFSDHQDSYPGLENAQNQMNNMISIIEAVSASLGLENSALAWACVTIVLQKVLSILPSHISWPIGTVATETIPVIDKMLSQLSTITSMIARYDVMENLYNRNPSMTLRADYEATLLALSCKILTWFAAAFNFIHDGLSEKAGNEMEGLDAILEEVRGMDKVCQRFTVVIEEREEGSEDDSVSERMTISRRTQKGPVSWSISSVARKSRFQEKNSESVG